MSLFSEDDFPEYYEVFKKPKNNFIWQHVHLFYFIELLMGNNIQGQGEDCFLRVFFFFLKKISVYLLLFFSFQKLVIRVFDSRPRNFIPFYHFPFYVLFIELRLFDIIDLTFISSRKLFISLLFLYVREGLCYKDEIYLMPAPSIFGKAKSSQEIYKKGFLYKKNKINKLLTIKMIFTDFLYITALHFFFFQ